MLKDYYAILNVDRNAIPHEIKKAYRFLAKVYHPDRNPGNKHFEEKMKDLNEAYEILGNPNTRSTYNDAYDLELKNRKQLKEEVKEQQTEESELVKNLKNIKEKLYSFTYLELVKLARQLRTYPRYSGLSSHEVNLLNEVYDLLLKELPSAMIRAFVRKDPKELYDLITNDNVSFKDKNTIAEKLLDLFYLGKLEPEFLKGVVYNSRVNNKLKEKAGEILIEYYKKSQNHIELNKIYRVEDLPRKLKMKIVKINLSNKAKKAKARIAEMMKRKKK